MRISTNTNKIYFYTAQPIPSVAIIPLGTGNDLSRVLGWGKEHDSHLEPMELLQKVQAAEEVKLDRYMIYKNDTYLNYRLIRSTYNLWDLGGP